jgi:NADPH-dependent ferric siderophore reductase
MTDRPERRRPRATAAQVRSVERITPHMIRIVLGGDGLAEFRAGEHSDEYVKLLFPADGVTYPEPFDLVQIRATLPRDQWPRLRTYTVRRWDAAQRVLTIDVVHHGDEGLAGPWAARVRPGDMVRFTGPSGAYAPDPAADWHLMVGDESALPAIAASLERLAPAARAHVFVEVSSPEEELKLDTPGDVEVRWLHRGTGRVGEALVRTVSGFAFPDGAVQVFAHGEAGLVKELRRLLFVERGIARAGQSISGYWRLGHDEDRWQATKGEWNASVEREQDGPRPGG